MTQPGVQPDFRTFLATFLRIGCLSFGGPAGQIAMLHRETVDERGWIDDRTFLEALNFCHLLPGPEAQQLATWIGWRLHGVRGGIAAGLLFILPGAAVMLALSIAYGSFFGLAWFAGLFLGIKAAVLAIVVQALIRIAGRALGGAGSKAIAICAFISLFLLDLPFPLVVLAAGLFGLLFLPGAPSDGVPAPGHAIGAALRHSLLAVVSCGILWAAPMLAIAATLGTDHRLWNIGTFFSKLAVVTFGGAYAVLAYMAQATVTDLHWLAPGAMVDGLGLAETTPGPLILVTQFVGYLAAAGAPQPFTPFVAGLLGALLTTWVTFVPCFLWIFAFAPWIDRLRQARRLRGALSAITAAVVGVIANLTLWFFLHVLFTKITPVQVGPLHVQIPDWTSFQPLAAVLAIIAAALIFWRKWSILRTLPVMAAAGLVMSLVA